MVLSTVMRLASVDYVFWLIIITARIYIRFGFILTETKLSSKDCVGSHVRSLTLGSEELSNLLKYQENVNANCKFNEANSCP